MNGKRQTLQYSLALEPLGRGETLVGGYEGAEPFVAKPTPESPASTEQLMEEVCDRENLERAWKRVRSNQGSPGVDGMTIDDAKCYLREHWPSIRSRLLDGTYQPQPVKRVEIPKPDGGVRKLGVPCVVDRLIQQALLQVLQERWDPTFSEHSYGFRPGRSAHQAVAQAQRYIAEGYSYVVDIDLEKFFDRVNHDGLMARVASRVSDKRVLKLIRAFLNAGVMEDGLVRPVDEGTPQGGPLSPLLSNLVLDDLDKELARRGHRFCRYADDCNIYVRSRRAGERVMASVSRFLTRKLRLKVNEAKSAVARPEERKFLGFSIANDGSERRIAPKALDKFKMQIRDMTSRTRGISLPQLIEELTPYLIGWRGYFGFCQTPRVLTNLEAWIRRRLRAYLWRQWRNGHNRFNELRHRGVPKFNAAVAAGSPTGFWRMSGHPAVQQALRNHYFDSLGLPRLHVFAQAQASRTAVVRDPYARWCGRGGAVRCPPIPINLLHYMIRQLLACGFLTQWY
jgi:RNA-directed DNA polymerase